MTAHPMMVPMRGLYGQPRDNYIGQFQPPLAEVREPARLVSVRATGRTALVLIEVSGQTQLIRAEHVDAPGLEILSALDRATVAAAVATLHREGGPADAA